MLSRWADGGDRGCGLFADVQGADLFDHRHSDDGGLTRCFNWRVLSYGKSPQLKAAQAYLCSCRICSPIGCAEKWGRNIRSRPRRRCWMPGRAAGRRKSCSGDWGGSWRSFRRSEIVTGELKGSVRAGKSVARACMRNWRGVPVVAVGSATIRPRRWWRCRGMQGRGGTRRLAVSFQRHVVVAGGGGGSAGADGKGGGEYNVTNEGGVGGGKIRLLKKYSRGCFFCRSAGGSGLGQGGPKYDYAALTQLAEAAGTEGRAGMDRWIWMIRPFSTPGEMPGKIVAAFVAARADIGGSGDAESEFHAADPGDRWRRLMPRWRGCWRRSRGKHFKTLAHCRGWKSEPVVEPAWRRRRRGCGWWRGRWRRRLWGIF